MHSLTTASLARTLCQKYSQDDTNPADCHLAGLLHDFGKVVFAQFLPTEFKEALALSHDQSISLHAAEHQIIGADHTLVGGMLVEKWQLSKDLTDNIRNHHSVISPDNTVQSCLFVADQISKQLLLTSSGNPLVEEIPPTLAVRFNGSLQDIVADLGDLSKLEDEAMLLAQAGKGGQ
jgi:putative nucleotidyltransferase with HDIG domain